MLRLVRAGKQQRGGRVSRQKPQQRFYPGAMRLHDVEAPHQEVEQPVPDAALGRGVEQCRLIGEAAEPQHDRCSRGETLARLDQRQTGFACGGDNVDLAPSLLAGHAEGRGDQGGVEFRVRSCGYR